MPREIPSAFAVKTIRKWVALAERRKAHLVDLYESGRWRLYYSEEGFIKCLRKAIHEVDRWSATERVSALAAVSGLGLDRELIGERVNRSNGRHA